MANWDHQSNIGTHPELHGATHNGLAQFGGNVQVTMPDVEDTHIAVGSLITVTIGRNVGTVPMYGPSWDEFRNQIKTLLAQCSDQIFGPFTGLGQWDGITEESATFTAVTNQPFTPAILDGQLASVAAWYDQDAIAWSYGAARLAVRV